MADIKFVSAQLRAIGTGCIDDEALAYRQLTLAYNASLSLVGI